MMMIMMTDHDYDGHEGEIMIITPGLRAEIKYIFTYTFLKSKYRFVLIH